MLGSRAVACAALLGALTLSYAASAQMMMMDRDEPTQALKATGRSTVTAKIAAIDTAKRTVNLEDGKQYVVGPDADLRAFKPGDQVKVEYTVVANFNMVASIAAVN